MTTTITILALRKQIETLANATTKPPKRFGNIWNKYGQHFNEGLLRRQQDGIRWRTELADAMEEAGVTKLTAANVNYHYPCGIQRWMPATLYTHADGSMFRWRGKNGTRWELQTDDWAEMLENGQIILVEA